MKYRADIDGLRALAVLPVIAYHLGVTGIPGGFTGVDIFFVISGYLICGIIYQSAMKGEFSYLEFYKRRCLRILPPLFVVLIATLLFGYHNLLPAQFTELGNSAIATTLFSSNIFFWQQTGYFAGPAELKPLLHTWSLAVEEQFYILFPIVLLFAVRWFRHRVTQVMLAIIAVSFLLSVVGVLKKPDFTFYMLPTRAWELAIGGLIAVSTLETRMAAVRQEIRHLMSLAGLALILFGFFWLSTSKPFPSWNALWPCLGSFLLILAGREAIVNRILALKPVVYIGMISYCLYLWHWPLIVYSKMFLNMDEGMRDLLVLTLTFGLAIASRYLIEIPFRYKLSNLNPVAVSAFSVIGLVLIASATLYKSHISNESGNFSDQALAVAKFSQYHGSEEYFYQYRLGKCLIDGNNEAKGHFDRDFCLKTSSTEKNYLLVGDSHGAHLWRALSLAAGENVNLMQATSAGCKPVSHQSIDNKCTELMEYIYQQWIPKHKVDGIIISARWLPEDIAPLKDTLKALKKINNNITVMGPTIEYAEALPDLLAYQESGRKDLVSRSINHNIKGTDLRMRQAMAEEKVGYISVYNIMCPNDVCHALASNGQPSAFDYGHFTLSGANDVARQAMAQMHKNKFM
ncbi:acyltransferase [Pantoea alhagi]|uniref:Acyltransferase n=1 Tax=Pantoea alhagi TaxID=1891675 RepID=A0A1W6B6A5_9GAMM|nr:acyltransferase family protein [Pantoea alhagi]ARJ42593.1 acyltransferase [Pantoea alhagi]